MAPFKKILILTCISINPLCGMQQDTVATLSSWAPVFCCCAPHAVSPPQPAVAGNVQDGYRCPICLDTQSDSALELVVIPTCKHQFHKKCLEQWRSYHATCPVCRRELGALPAGSVPDLESPSEHPISVADWVRVCRNHPSNCLCTYAYDFAGGSCCQRQHACVDCVSCPAACCGQCLTADCSVMGALVPLQVCPTCFPEPSERRIIRCKLCVMVVACPVIGGFFFVQR